METEKKNTHFFVAHSIAKNQLTSDKIPQEWMTSTPAGCTLICTHMNEAFHRNRGASRPDIWEWDRQAEKPRHRRLRKMQIRRGEERNGRPSSTRPIRTITCRSPTMPRILKGTTSLSLPSHSSTAGFPLLQSAF